MIDLERRDLGETINILRKNRNESMPTQERVKKFLAEAAQAERESTLTDEEWAELENIRSKTNLTRPPEEL